MQHGYTILFRQMFIDMNKIVYDTDYESHAAYNMQNYMSTFWRLDSWKLKFFINKWHLLPMNNIHKLHLIFNIQYVFSMDSTNLI